MNKALVIAIGIIVALFGICNDFPPWDMVVSVVGSVIIGVGAGINIKD